MKTIILHLQKHWIKYGLETVAIVVGILGAFMLSSWHEEKIEKEKEAMYLSSLLDDLERQLDVIQFQREFEMEMVSNCEAALHCIHKPPFDYSEYNNYATKISRKSFVVNNPVFEDLKYSGNLSIISSFELRNDLLDFYQHMDYVETVFANNNSTWADGFSIDMINLAVADLSYTKDMTLATGFDFFIDSEPFINADQIIQSQLENNLLRFTLYNKLNLRGRVSTVHVHLLNDLEEKIHTLIATLKSFDE